MHAELDRALAAIRRATDGLDAADLAAHPPGKWCAAEILEHLAKAYASTAYILDRCVGQGTTKARRATLRDRVAAFVVVDLGYFPAGTPAPEITHPAGLPAHEAIGAAESALQAFDGAAARAEARFGRGTAVANHPILGPFNVRQWRRFHRVHTLHHMKQIARLRTRAR